MSTVKMGRQGRWNSEIKALRDRVAELEDNYQTALNAWNEEIDRRQKAEARVAELEAECERLKTGWAKALSDPCTMCALAQAPTASVSNDPCEAGDPPEGSRLWRCEKELVKAREEIARLENSLSLERDQLRRTAKHWHDDEQRLERIERAAKVLHDAMLRSDGTTRAIEYNAEWAALHCAFTTPHPDQRSSDASPDRRFPILYGHSREANERRAKGPKDVPWSLLAPHESQAQRNHGQTLQRLAERGGLDPNEMIAIIEGKPWREVFGLNPDDALTKLVKLVDAHEQRTNDPCPHPKNMVTSHALSSGSRMLSWCGACGARKLWNQARALYPQTEGTWATPTGSDANPPGGSNGP